MQIRTYLMAVHGIAHEAVARAARLFMRGEVKDQNPDFAPSCASFAKECRYQQSAIEAERRPRIAKQETEDDSPRVDPRKLHILHEALNGNVVAIEALREMFPNMEALK